MQENSKKKVDPYLLSVSQMDAIKDWLTEKEKKDASCEICGNETWIIQEHLVAPLIFGKSYTFGNRAYPHAIIVCSKCGNTKFINAAMMGILKQSEGETDDK